MVGLLGTVVGMIGAFAVLTSAGMGGEASKQMAGNIGVPFGPQQLVSLLRFPV